MQLMLSIGNVSQKPGSWKIRLTGLPVNSIQRNVQSTYPITYLIDMDPSSIHDISRHGNVCTEQGQLGPQ